MPSFKCLAFPHQRQSSGATLTPHPPNPPPPTHTHTHTTRPNTRSKYQCGNSVNSAESFNMSTRWFTGFCRRNKILLRRKTHASQKAPKQLCNSISELHAKILREEEVHSLRRVIAREGV